MYSVKQWIYTLNSNTLKSVLLSNLNLTVKNCITNSSQRKINIFDRISFINDYKLWNLSHYLILIIEYDLASPLGV